ncbi:hypothetical protein [Curtobacterium sp. MCBA15_012]|uniref:hypothetical protein n=1 Tax=Curtobacterium sp. MCBA15_012 TaxID=1898738 RepID=UPI0008DD125D|nr:hypothetical protein [Curtobacterium sp. MCBA15_012]WIA99724.1 hypothetical protein QOL15_14615 [Curtobacterium sp. MCBA15_012]
MTTTDTYDADTVELASARARIALVSAAELVEHVLAHRMPARAVPDGQPGVPMESRTAAIPGNTTAVDDADAIYAELTKWVRFWAGALRISTAKLRIRRQWATDTGRPLGFTADVDPGDARTAVRDVAGWLLAEHDHIGRSIGATDYFGDVARLIETVESRFPAEARPARPHWQRQCPICGRLGVTTVWEPGADVRDVRVWCEGCSTVLVSTSADGEIRTTDRLPRSRDHVNPGDILPARKLVAIVRQIAAGTTVPEVENPEVGTPHVGRCAASGVDPTEPSDGGQRVWQCVRRQGHQGAHRVSRTEQPALVWSREPEGASA